MIWNKAPHRCSTYSLTTSVDAGGGNSNSYTLAQASIPCLISTSSSSTSELYAQDNITVSHTVGIKSSLLTTAVTRGMKVTDEAGLSYHVEGIRSGRAFMGIPAFTYLDCRQIL